MKTSSRSSHPSCRSYDPPYASFMKCGSCVHHRTAYRVHDMADRPKLINRVLVWNELIAQLENARHVFKPDIGKFESHANVWIIHLNDSYFNSAALSNTEPEKSLRDIGHLAVWRVSTAKPGNGTSVNALLIHQFINQFFPLVRWAIVSIFYRSRSAPRRKRRYILAIRRSPTSHRDFGISETGSDLRNSPPDWFQAGWIVYPSKNKH